MGRIFSIGVSSTTKMAGKSCKVQEKTKVQTFMKVLNVSHLIPTRYSVEKEINVKALVPETFDMNDREAKSENCDKIAKDLETKFSSAKKQHAVGVNFLRQKLRF